MFPYISEYFHETTTHSVIQQTHYTEVGRYSDVQKLDFLSHLLTTYNPRLNYQNR